MISILLVLAALQSNNKDIEDAFRRDSIAVADIALDAYGKSETHDEPLIVHRSVGLELCYPMSDGKGMTNSVIDQDSYVDRIAEKLRMPKPDRDLLLDSCRLWAHGHDRGYNEGTLEENERTFKP